MKVIARLLVLIIASFFAAIDSAVFYFAVGGIFDVKIGWAIVGAVFWCQESMLSFVIRKELRKQGLL